MEFLFSFIAFIVSIVSIIQIGNLRTELNVLKRNFDRLKSNSLLSHNQEQNILASTDEPINEQKLEADPIINELAHEELTSNIQTTQVPTAPSFDIVAWFAKDWLVKVGALMVFLAATWFLGNVFGAISNELKVIIVLFISVAVFLGGLFLLNINKVYGEVLLILGAFTAISTLSIGHFVLGLFPWFVVTLGSLLLIGLVFYIAISKQSFNLATVATIGFYLVPFISSSGENNFVVLGLYLLIINVMIMLLSKKLNWYFLATISIIATFFYIAVMSPSILQLDPLQAKTYFKPEFWIVILNIIVLYAVNIIQTVSKHNVTFITYLNNILISLLLIVVIPLLFFQEFQNFIILILIVVLFALSVVLYKLKINLNYIYIQLVSCAGLFIYLTYSLFGNTQWFAFLLAIEFLVASYSMSRVFQTDEPEKGFLAAQFLPILVCFGSLADIFGTNVVNFPVLLALITVLVHIVLFKYNASDDNRAEPLPNILFFITLLGIARSIWLISSGIIMDPNLVVILNMVLYTIISIFLIFISPPKFKNLELKYLGWIILGFVLIRLFLIDVWALSLEARIVVFVMVGILLILTPFLSKNLTKKIK